MSVWKREKIQEVLWSSTLKSLPDRKRLGHSTTKRTFHMRAVALATFLKRLATPVRSLTVEEEDSSMLEALMCLQCSAGKS